MSPPLVEPLYTMHNRGLIGRRTNMTYRNPSYGGRFRSHRKCALSSDTCLLSFPWQGDETDGIQTKIIADRSGEARPLASRFRIGALPGIERQRGRNEASQPLVRAQGRIPGAFDRTGRRLAAPLRDTGHQYNPSALRCENRFHQPGRPRAVDPHPGRPPAKQLPPQIARSSYGALRPESNLP